MLRETSQRRSAETPLGAPRIRCSRQNGDDAVLLIDIKATIAGLLRITAGSSTVRGLVVNAGFSAGSLIEFTMIYRNGSGEPGFSGEQC